MAESNRDDEARLSVPPSGELPEYYVDSLGLAASAYTVTLVFGRQSSPTEQLPLVVVNMSPTHAKVAALALAKMIREYEEQMGVEIAIPPALLREKGLSQDSE